MSTTSDTAQGTSVSEHSRAEDTSERLSPSAPALNSAGSGEQLLTAANAITVLRLILVPFAFTVLVQGHHDILAFALFAIAGLSDFLDGQIARRTNTVTEFGKAIDPLVDRFLIAAGVMGLYMVGRLPVWTVLLLVGRDFTLLAGLGILKRYTQAAARVFFIGKVTTACLLVGFAGLIANLPHAEGLGWTASPLYPGFSSGPYCVWVWFVYVGIVCSLATFICYLTFGLRALARDRHTNAEV